MPLPINIPVDDVAIKSIKIELLDGSPLSIRAIYEYLPIDTNGNEIVALPQNNVVQETVLFSALPAATQSALVAWRDRGKVLAVADVEAKLTIYDV